MVQIARPSSDITANWTPTTGSTHWGCIDEVTANDDTDAIDTGANPVSLVCEVKFGSLTDPLSSSGHVVRYRFRRGPQGGKNVSLTADLRQGATSIASWAHLDAAIVNSYTTFQQTLSSGQADSITDYTDLRLRLTATTTGGGGSTGVRFTWTELEVPDGVAAYVGDSDGIATVGGNGLAIATSEAGSSSLATASGNGIAVVVSGGTSAGSATATGTSGVGTAVYGAGAPYFFFFTAHASAAGISSGIGVSNGTSSITGSAIAIAYADGLSSGSGSASGVGLGLSVGVGSSLGSGSVSGIGQGISTGIGAANGSALVSGISEDVGQGVEAFAAWFGLPLFYAGAVQTGDEEQLLGTGIHWSGLNEFVASVSVESESE